MCSAERLPAAERAVPLPHIRWQNAACRGSRKEGQSPGPARPRASALPSLFVTWVCTFPVAAVTNSHKTSGLKQQIYYVTALEVRSLKSRCQQAVLLLEPLREKLFPSPSQLVGAAPSSGLGAPSFLSETGRVAASSPFPSLRSGVKPPV